MDGAAIAANVRPKGRAMTEQAGIEADIVLRPARPEDAAACASIFNAWVDATDWMPRVHPPEDVERHFRETVLPTRAVTVAERGGVLGFIAVGDGQVEGLYLAPEARGRGVGTALVDRAKAAWPAGLALWAFAANAPARRFYARRGFIELRRTDGDNEEGLPDVLLCWPGAL
jgi:GNAT superfamily N-acetyltransferase